MGAGADCELIRTGVFAQPVNSITSLVFVVAGFYLMGRRSNRWVGIALAATGLGSFLFHGPLAPGGEWVHDVTLAWLLLVVATLSTSWEPLAMVPGLLLLSVLYAVAPGSADWTAAGLAVVAAVSLLRHGRETLLPLTLLGVTALVGRLGSTGGPLCDPASVFQAHGLWHVGAATAVTWWAVARNAASARVQSLESCQPRRSAVDDLDQRREAAVQRLKAKRDFRNHVAIYIIVNALLVVIWAVSGAGYFWPIWPMAGWGVGLAFNAWAVYFQQPISEEEIRQEMERGL